MAVLKPTFPLYLLIGGGLFLSMSQEAQAQHRWLDPRVEGRITLTDNVNLTESNRTGDVVLNLGGGLNSRYEGNRIQAALDYSIDYLYFLSDGETDFRQELFGSLDAEVIEDHLFIGARGSIEQRFLNQRGSLSSNFANRTNNRRALQTYTTSALLRGGLGNFADWRINYRFGLQFSPADNLEDETLTINFSDTKSHELNATVGSGNRFNNFSWRVGVSHRQVLRNLEQSNDFKDQNAFAELIYKFNRHFQLIGNLSYSNNDFQNAVLNQQGFGWETGFRWTPGRKLDLTLTGGKTGDRTTWSGNLQYFFTKRLDFLGTYSDTITANTLLTNNDLQGFRFDQELGLVDPQGIPVDETDPRFSFSDIDFRRRSLRGTLTWRHKRDRAFISADAEWRTFDNDSGTAKSYGVSGRWIHEIDRKTTLETGLSYRRSRFEGQTRVDDFIVGSLDWSKTISEYFRASINFTHSERQSSEQGADLEENALTLYLRGTF